PLEQGTRYRHALPHHANHIEFTERASCALHIVQPLIEYHQAVGFLQAGPGGPAQGGVFVVVGCGGPGPRRGSLVRVGLGGGWTWGGGGGGKRGLAGREGAG